MTNMNNETKDLTVGEVSSPLFSPASAPSPSLFEIRDTLDRIDKRDKSVANAGMLEKTQAFVENAKNINFGVEMFRVGRDALEDSQIEVDPNFTMNDEDAINYIQQRKLPMGSFGDIRNAKSNYHLYVLTERIKSRMAMDEKIDNTLGEFGKTSSAVAGALLDVDLAVGLSAGMIWKSASLGKIVAYEGALEGVLATSRAFIKEDYSASDFIFDVTLGTVIAGGGTAAVRSFAGGRTRNEMTDELNDIEKTELDEMGGAKAVETGTVDDVPVEEVTDFNEYVKLQNRDLVELGVLKGKETKTAEDMTRIAELEAATISRKAEIERIEIEQAQAPTPDVEPTPTYRPVSLPAFKERLWRVEGTGDYFQPKNKYGYEGKYQFRFKKKGDLGNVLARRMGVSANQIRKSPELQEKMMDLAIDDYVKGLNSRGLPVTEYNLWLVHNQGLGGANAILTGKLTPTIRRNIRAQGIKGRSDADLIAKYHAKFRKRFLGDEVRSQMGKSRTTLNQRIANAEDALNDATSAMDRRNLQRELDELMLEKSRRVNQEEEIEFNNRRDAETERNRSENYNTNREEFYGRQKDIEIEDALKRIEELEEQYGKAAPNSKARAKLQKQLDKEMDKLYRNSVDNPTTRLIRAIDGMDKDVQGMKAEIDAVRAEVGDDEFLRIIDDVKQTHPEEIAAIEDIVTKPMTKESQDKFVETMTKAGMSRKKALAAALLLGGTGAVAGDDSNAAMITAGFLAMVLTPVLAPAILRSVKEAGGVTNAAGRVANRVRRRWDNSAKRANQATSKRESQLRRVAKTIADMAHTRFTSTIAPFKKAGGKVAKIAEDLMYSADKGGGAEIDKASWAHATMAKYNDMEVKWYKVWKSEKQEVIGDGGTMSDALDRSQFRQELSDAVEMIAENPQGFAQLPDSLKNAAKEYDVIKKEIYDRAVEYGVFGFVDRVVTRNGKEVTIKGKSHEDGMIPRYWNSGRMNELINSADDVDEVVEGLTEMLTKAFYRTNGDWEASKGIAAKFVDDWKTGRNLGSAGTPVRGDDLYSSINTLLKDDVTVEELSEALAIPKERISRAKERIAMKASDLDSFTTKINGEDFTFDKSILIERDAKAILDRTANSMYGASALAKRGYDRVATLERAIRDATEGIKDGDVLRQELLQVTDLILGVPIDSKNRFLHEISMIIKDMVIIAKLPMVAFSMPPELIATLMTSSLGRGLRSFKRALLREYHTDSNMLQLISMTGLGTSYKRLDFTGFRGYGDVGDAIDDVGAISAIRDKTMKMRDLSLILNGLSVFSDGLQRMSMELHLEKIAAFVNKGDTSAKGIPEGRRAEFGIDDEFMEMFKDTFELDGDAVKAFDSSKWSVRKRDKLAETLRIMNQQTSPETTIGESALYAKSTDMGRAISALLTYPMGQFNQYGLNDLRHLDRGALLHSAGAFMGAYIGLSMRYAIQNKEVSEEDIMLYSLMNIPQLGALTTFKSMLDPAGFSLARDTANLVLPQALETR